MNEIIENLLNGKVVAIPTDTVYGLICDANNSSAIDSIFDIKGRDKNKPFGIFLKDISTVYDYIDEDQLSENVKRLMNEYWPGPLTIIFKKKENVLTHLNNGSRYIGIRIPSDQRLLSLLSEIDIPLVQTSCNLSGEPPYTNSSIIKEKFKDKIGYIVEGEILNDSISSTVIDVSDGDIKVIRHGDISEKEKLKS